ncbi:MAG: NAD(P)-binding protein, partial [Oscillospiraceae bacterium]|nr:NAD(P)-binding protein [Oscillospiraceae bacterium]
MDKHFDVIVVGAGNGGLAAAANTAKAGLKTLLLEKHNIPGGCATSFRRGRFEFEPSLHELCSVGTAEKPDQVYKVFDDLGAKPNWCYETGHLFRAIVKGEN